MKVLHVFNEIKYSGAEIMYADAAPLFQENGVEMIALSTGQRIGEFLDQFESANIKVYHRPLINGLRNPIKLFIYFKGIFDFVKIEEMDVIHIHRDSYYWFFSLVGFLNGIRTIRTVHNVFKNRKITWVKAVLERFIARKIFGLIFQTIGDSVYLNERNYYKNPSIKINNWYNTDKFFPATTEREKNQLRAKLNISTDALVVISTGGCSHVKNHHDIIKAVQEVNKITNCIFLHLGTGVTENEEVSLTEELGISNKIRFLGNQTNVREYLIAADIYIMSSRFEGLSIASIEAMACGLPSVLYNVPGLRDLITDDDNGALIKPDYQVLSEKILFFYNSPYIRNQRGENARKFVGENFNMNKSVKSIIDLYNRR